MTELSPYDTGERLQPAPWPVADLAAAARSLTAEERDRFGRVDFDTPESETAVTVVAKTDSSDPSLTVVVVTPLAARRIRIVVQDRSLDWEAAPPEPEPVGETLFAEAEPETKPDEEAWLPWEKIHPYSRTPMNADPESALGPPEPAPRPEPEPAALLPEPGAFPPAGAEDIAAARALVAFASETGAEVPEWARQLAITPLPDERS